MKLQKHYFIHLIFLLIAIFIIYTRNKFQQILNDLSNPIFLFFLIMLILFSYWGLYIEKDDERIRTATGRAISGFIIAYLAHADLMFIAYIVIWIFVFHTGNTWL